MMFLIFIGFALSNDIIYSSKIAEIEEYEFTLSYNDNKLYLDVIYDFRKFKAKYDLNKLDISNLINENPEILTKLLISFLDGDIEYSIDIIDTIFTLELKLNLVLDVYQNIKIILEYEDTKDENEKRIKHKINSLESEIIELKEENKKTKMELLNKRENIVYDYYHKKHQFGLRFTEHVNYHNFLIEISDEKYQKYIDTKINTNDKSQLINEYLSVNINMGTEHYIGNLLPIYLSYQSFYHNINGEYIEVVQFGIMIQSNTGNNNNYWYRYIYKGQDITSANIIPVKVDIVNKKSFRILERKKIYRTP